MARSTHSNQTSGITKPYVVVIFGRTGVGISSLVNLIAGYYASNDHSDARTAASEIVSHNVSLRRSSGQLKEFLLYEVPGFSVDIPDETVLDKIRQIERHKRIDLFIYCFRKQKKFVLPKVVRSVRDIVRVPMIAIVTELEREVEMDEWWSAEVGDGFTNGTMAEQMCFEGDDWFDEHACVTTLPLRDTDLLEKLRKQRDLSEERIRKLILAQCRGGKRVPDPPSGCFACLRALLG